MYIFKLTYKYARIKLVCIWVYMDTHVCLYMYTLIYKSIYIQKDLPTRRKANGKEMGEDIAAREFSSEKT